jgi:hypothetical protein
MISPSIEKTTTAVNIDVKKSVTETIKASFTKLLLTGLYDDKAMRHPNARPNE